METVFEFNGILTKDLLRRFYRYQMKQRVSRWLLAALGIISIILGLLVLTVSEWWLGITALLLGVLCLFFTRITTEILLATFCRTHRAQYNMKYSVYFDDEAILDCTPYGETRIPYSLIYRVVETDGLILVYLGAYEVVMLEPRYCIKGVPAALLPFLTERGVKCRKKG